MIGLNQIKRESFRTIDETCPDVDEAFEVCNSKIKEKTTALRSALESWIERALEAEDRIDELQARIGNLEAQLISLEQPI